MNTLTEAEKKYTMYALMEAMYMANTDYTNAMRCKWSLLINNGGSL